MARETRATWATGTRVTWVTAAGVFGSGVTISDETDGHILVAVDNVPGEEHHVIWCTVTWLTVEQHAAPPAMPPVD